MFNLKRTILAASCISIMLCGCGRKVPDASAELTEVASDNQPTSSIHTVTVTDEAESTVPPTEEAATEPEESDIPDPVLQKLEELTLHQKVCQMFIVTPEQITDYGCVTLSDQAMKQGLDNYSVGGMIFFADNLVCAVQIHVGNGSKIKIEAESAQISADSFSYIIGSSGIIQRAII